MGGPHGRGKVYQPAHRHANQHNDLACGPHDHGVLNEVTDNGAKEDQLSSLSLMRSALGWVLYSRLPMFVPRSMPRLMCGALENL